MCLNRLIISFTGLQLEHFGFSGINVSEINSGNAEHDFMNDSDNPLTHKTFANLENLKHQSMIPW
jgi:hypothetical protein